MNFEERSQMNFEESAFKMFESVGKSVDVNITLPNNNVASTPTLTTRSERFPQSDHPIISICTFHGKLESQDVYRLNTTLVVYNEIPIEILFNRVTSLNSISHFDYSISQIQYLSQIYNFKTLTTVNNKGFPNGCNFKIKNTDENRTIDCKLFANCKLQITGCKSIEEIHKVAALIIKLLEMLFTIKYTFTNIVISMIRANFNANFKIDLKKFVNIIDEHYPLLRREYSPEDFRGVKLYWIAPFCVPKKEKQQHLTQQQPTPHLKEKQHLKEKHVTFIIHSSGKIAIMCHQSFENVNRCWTFINEILKTHYTQLVSV